jgi:purine-binding chemotaxis protein CheW
MQSWASGGALSTERLDVVLLELAEQRFALPLSHVREITRACSLQPLPHAPRMILGVLNLRGQILPVVDLRRQLNLPSTPLAPSDYFIIAGIGEQTVALRVDQVIGMVQLEAGSTCDAQRVPESLTFISGIATTPDGVILIYDLQQFLTDSEALELSIALSRLVAHAVSA